MLNAKSVVVRIVVKVFIENMSVESCMVVWRIAHNVLALGVVAGFGVQSCQPALHLNRSTNLQVCTAYPDFSGSPRLTQNPCCAFGFLFCQASLTKLSSSLTLKLISAFNALNTLIMVSIVALLAPLSSFEI